MGFSEKDAAESLKESHNDFESALNTLSLKAAEKEEQEEKKEKKKAPAASQKPPEQPDRSAQGLSRLVEMGFSPEQARQAMEAKGGSQEAAIEYLLSLPQTASQPSLQQFFSLLPSFLPFFLSFFFFLFSFFFFALSCFSLLALFPLTLPLLLFSFFNCFLCLMMPWFGVSDQNSSSFSLGF